MVASEQVELQCRVYPAKTGCTPRGLLHPPATVADYRAYQAYAQERTYHHHERIHVDYPPEHTEQ